MLDLRLELAEINYKKCVESMLPPLVEHCAAKVNPNSFDRFLAGLGKDAVPAAAATLDEMDADAKDMTVVWMISAHEERLRNSANRHLAEALGGDMIRIGRLVALDRPGSRLALVASQVEVDYNALLNSPLVGDSIDKLGSEHSVLKGAAKLVLSLGSILPADSLEKQSIALIGSGRVKDKLMTMLGDTLRKAGLEVTIEDMSVEAASGRYAEPTPVPAAFEQELMRSLTAKAQALRS